MRVARKLRRRSFIAVVTTALHFVADVLNNSVDDVAVAGFHSNNRHGLLALPRFCFHQRQLVSLFVY